MSIILLPSHDSPEAGGGITVYTQRDRNCENLRGGSSVMYSRLGRKAEAELEIRDFDLRALDDSSHLTATSKTCTFVHNVTIRKVLVIER